MLGIYRTLLAFGVLLYHFPVFLFPLPDTYGRVMVSAFFIISGYLITLTLNRNYTSAVSFYWNRAIRLYPLHLVLIVIGLVLIYFGVYDKPVPTLSDLSKTLYFDVRKYETVNDPTWSIGIEVVFYLLAPFIVYSWKRMLAVTALCVLYLASKGNAGLLLGAYNLNPQNDSILTMVALAFPLFMFGGFLYKIKFRIPDFQWVAMSLLLIGVLMNDAFWITMIATTLLLLSGDKEKGFSKLAGDFCYPIYMIHFMVIYTVSNPWVSIALTVILSAVWIVVERRLIAPSKLNKPLDVRTKFGVMLDRVFDFKTVRSV